MKLDFYNVDKAYIAYLQQAELQKRGFTRVPNMDYEGRKQKFLCGVVFNAPTTGLKYFVGVTHYKVQRSENFLIVVPDDQVPVKGSLRFNYMFPVPGQLITRKEISSEPDTAYRILLSKELKSINEHTDEILGKAESVYRKIVSRTCSQNLLLNSCDFPYLEEKCADYCRIHSLTLEPHMTNEEKMVLNAASAEQTPWNDLLVNNSKAKEREAEVPHRYDPPRERER